MKKTSTPGLAALWALAYGVLGVAWALGAPGYLYCPGRLWAVRHVVG